MFSNFLKSSVAKLKSFFFTEDFLFLVVLLVTVIVLWLKFNHVSNIVVNNTVHPPIVAVEKRTDTKGTQYSEIKQTLYTQDQVNHITDSLKRTLKASGVKSVTTEVSDLEGEVHTSKTLYIDTGKRTVFDTYQDKYLYIEYTGNLETDYGLFKFGFLPDTATYVTNFKRHLFKPTEYKVDVYHTNDYFKKSVVAGSSFTYKEPKHIIDFDLFVGYDPFIKKIVVAPGIGVHLFSIKRKK